MEQPSALETRSASSRWMGVFPLSHEPMILRVTPTLSASSCWVSPLAFLIFLMRSSMCVPPVGWMYGVRTSTCFLLKHLGCESWERASRAAGWSRRVARIRAEEAFDLMDVLGAEDVIAGRGLAMD